MVVRAKMRVTGLHRLANITSSPSDPPHTVQVTLQPVYGTGQDDANAQWSRWTPSGELRLSITNPAAYEQFELGRTYYVDMSPTED